MSAETKKPAEKALMSTALAFVFGIVFSVFVLLFVNLFVRLATGFDMLDILLLSEPVKSNSGTEPIDFSAISERFRNALFLFFGAMGAIFAGLFASYFKLLQNK